MSDTPRTDAATFTLEEIRLVPFRPDMDFVLAASMRQLEREMQGELAELKEGHRLACERTAEVLRELDGLRRDKERLIESVKIHARAVGFFASVIRGGEPWTTQCQECIDRIDAMEAQEIL